jgi:hypothetical protein
LAAKKLTRKEIVREDAIRKTLTETSHWAVQNLNYLVAAAGLVVVSVVVFVAWQAYSSSRAEAMQAAFADAMAMFHAPLSDEDAEALEMDLRSTKYEFESESERYEHSLAAFGEVAENYPGSRVGVLSRYYQALCLARLNRTDDSREVLGRVVRESRHPSITNLARNALAQHAVGEGNRAEAIDQFERILDEPSENFPQHLILMRLGQTLESMGDLEGAVARYRQVTTEHSGSASASEASLRIRRLEPRIRAATDGIAAEADVPESDR